MQKLAVRARQQMVGVFAELETAIRRERQLEGIAKAKGIYKRRMPSVPEDGAKRLGAEGPEASVIAKKLGIARSSVGEALKWGRGSRLGFHGALELKRAPKGLFVTASSFSRDARIQAESATRQIVLIDGEELATLAIRHKVGTRGCGDCGHPRGRWGFLRRRTPGPRFDP